MVPVAAIKHWQKASWGGRRFGLKLLVHLGGMLRQRGGGRNKGHREMRSLASILQPIQTDQATCPGVVLPTENRELFHQPFVKKTPHRCAHRQFLNCWSLFPGDSICIELTGADQCQLTLQYSSSPASFLSGHPKETFGKKAIKYFLMRG